MTVSANKMKMSYLIMTISLGKGWTRDFWATLDFDELKVIKMYRKTCLKYISLLEKTSV